MKKFVPQYILIVWLTFSFLVAEGQSSKYWIPFTDKNNSTYSVNKPGEFLSEKAIARRTKQSIGITESDLPVNLSYIDSVRKIGFKILHSSKWLNGVIAGTDDSSKLQLLSELPFIKFPVKRISCASLSNIKDRSLQSSGTFPVEIPDYGNSRNQITMVRGDYLQMQGFEGENMLIAVLDAGFTNANSISSLINLWVSNRIVATKDFVDDTLSVLDANSHGTLVLSIMAGVIDNLLYGTAPQADFALIRTENANSECIIEEYNWACGAEFADSLGADIINSSLGYSTFNDSSQNHTYKDMNGRTTPAAIAADFASAKGMLVVVSAGNEGNKKWFRITTPADANNVLSVGAVNQNGNITNFSSRGPSVDKRIKPDICAQGLGTFTQSEKGIIITINGTSCSAPLITGLSACLWGANPKCTSLELLSAIRKGGLAYDQPDSAYGFGIANFLKSDRILKMNYNADDVQDVQFNLFPNPARDYFYLEIIRRKDAGTENIRVRFLDMIGNTVAVEQHSLTDPYTILEFQQLDHLNTGIYTVRIEFADHIHSMLFMKSF